MVGDGKGHTTASSLTFLFLGVWLSQQKQKTQGSPRPMAVPSCSCYRVLRSSNKELMCSSCVLCCVYKRGCGLEMPVVIPRKETEWLCVEDATKGNQEESCSKTGEEGWTFIPCLGGSKGCLSGWSFSDVAEIKELSWLSSSSLHLACILP